MEGVSPAAFILPNYSFCTERLYSLCYIISVRIDKPGGTRFDLQLINQP